MGDESVYEKIADMKRLSGSKRLIRILKNGFTPEEGELILGLSSPMTSEELAKKLNMDVEAVQTTLNVLSERSWVHSQKGKYSTFSVNIPQSRNSTMPGVPEEERRAQWLDWANSEEFSKWKLETWRRMTKINGGNAIYRILPAPRSLAASPNIKPEQILWVEDLPQIFKRATKIVVKACPCRDAWGTCDNPLESCIGWSFKETPENADHHGGKEITAAEAMAITENTEDRAMLDITLNKFVPGEFCTCCPCCCGVLYPYINYGDHITREATLAPSRFRAVIHREECSGCQTCVERCHFDAIEMQKMPNSKKLTANVTNEKCMGCGLCVIKCTQKAITLELVRPPEYIPAETNNIMANAREKCSDWLTNPNL